MSGPILPDALIPVAGRFVSITERLELTPYEFLPPLDH